MHRQRDPSFFRTKRTGAAWEEDEGQMKPEAKCSSRNVRRASSSNGEREYKVPNGGWVPSLSSIFRSYSRCGARVLALLLLKMSENSWYSCGTAERSMGSGAGAARSSAPRE